MIEFLPHGKGRPAEAPPMEPDTSVLCAVERSLVLGHLSVDDPSVFNVAEYLVISSCMSLVQLRAAIDCVHRHSQIGNHRYHLYGSSLGRIFDAREPNIVERDLAGFADADTRAIEWLRQGAQEVLDIFAGDTLRHQLARLPDGRIFWGILAHHAVTDNLGIKKMIDDVLAVSRGKSLAGVPASGSVVACHAQADAYWLRLIERFRGLLPIESSGHLLPGRGLKITAALPSLSGELRWRVRQEDYLRALLAALLIECRASNSYAAAVNLPVSTRHLTGQPGYGLAMSVVPLLFSSDRQASVWQNLKRLQQQLDDQNQYIAADLSNTPMDSDCRQWLAGLPAINLVHTDSDWRMDDWQVSRRYLASGAVQNYNITVRLGAEPTIEVDVHDKLYDFEDAQALLRCFTDAFHWLSVNPQAPLEDYFARFVHPPASNLHLELRPHGNKAIRLWAEPAELEPNQAPVMLTMSYGWLTRKVAKLARQLTAIMPSNQRYAIYLPRGLDSVLTTLAVYEAGATFVPVNVNMAAEELNELLLGLEIAVVITDMHGVSRLPCVAGLRVITLGYLEQRRLPTDRHYSTANHAYILRSSGSTGRPKSIPITRDGLDHYLQAMVRRYELHQEDVLLNLSLNNFDAWIEEVFGCLLVGGCLAISPPDAVLDHELLLRFCDETQVSVFNFSTNYWHQLVFFHHSPIRQSCPSARLAIIGGDLALDLAINQWLQGVGKGIRLINSYGPTEACVVATAMLIDQEFVPGNLVGTPLDNTCVVIKALDDDRILNAGFEGEVCLRGPSLTPGYLATGGEDGSRLIMLEDGQEYWRTGDRGFLDDQGRLFFIGRMNATIKFENEQVDVHLLERLLGSHFTEFQAHVSVSASHRGHKFIDIQLHGATERADKARVVDYLRATFPKLKAPFVVSLASSSQTRQPPTPASMAFEDAAETDALLEVWRCVLGDGVGVIERRSDFYSLGGTSLQALMIVNLCAEAFGVHLKMKQFYAHPTPSGLLKAIKDASQVGSVAPSATEQGTSDQIVWIIETLVEGAARHNLALVHDLSGPLDTARLQTCFMQLLLHTPALCQVVRLEQGTPRFSPSPTDIHPLAWHWESIKEPLAMRQQRALNHATERFITQPFDLANGLPIRLGLIDCGEHQYRLMLCVHHGFCDGVSASLLMTRLSRFYNGDTFVTGELTKGASHNPPASPEALAYWAEELLPHCNQSPSVIAGANDEAFDGRRLSVAFDEQMLVLFTSIQKHANLTLDQVVLTLYCRVLQRMVGEQSLVIGMPTANRYGHGAWQRIGSFSCTALLALHMAELSNADTLGAHLRRKLLGLHDHPGVSISELRGYLRDHFRAELPEPRFFFVSQPDAGGALKLRGIESESQPPGRLHAKAELALELVGTAGRMHLEWLYDSSLYSLPMVQTLHNAMMICAREWLDLEPEGLRTDTDRQANKQVTG